MAKCYIGDYSEDEKIIVCKDGEELIVPERTKDLQQKITEIEKRRLTMNEYDFYKSMLECLFEKDGFKHIAPDGEKTNLNYLGRVYVAAIDLFVKEKIELENEEIAKKAAQLNPITDKLKIVDNAAKHVK